jgi:hypothetical protein
MKEKYCTFKKSGLKEGTKCTGTEIIRGKKLKTHKKKER